MQKKIKELIERAKKDPSILAIAFFGSYARKEKYRDIDICIFMKNKNYGDLTLSKKRMKYMIDSTKYDVQIFQQLPIYIKKRIFKDAKVIYCKNYDKLYDLSFETIREFEHFRPIYEGYLEAIAND
jgi:uncharacterized protein